VGIGALSIFSWTRAVPTKSEAMRHRLHPIKIYALVGLVSVAAVSLLVLRGWEAPGPFPSKFWNALAAFAILGIICDSFSSRLPFAKVSTSVGFIPFIASVALFSHPWPMLVAGATGFVVEALVRHKPAVKVWFNTAQYMLATGLGSLVYVSLGGHALLNVSLGGVVSLDAFDFALIPFAALVFTFFVVNHGSVALAVSISSDVSLGEAWDRIGKDAIATDLLSSTLAILLVFLYARLELTGIAILIFPLFLVRQLYQMNQQLQEELEEKLELMVKAMEARDPYTSGHSRRVSEYALAIARELRLPARDLDGIKRAALLHDVGKIYEEFAPLLRKEGKLTAEEMMTMQTHVTRSAQLVATATRLRGDVEAMIRHHHENFDGTGYPEGLAGDQIPVGARIIMVADTIDAMTTDRPYRKAMSLSRAVEELEKYAGRQFDPDLVKLVAKSASIRRLLGLDRRMSEPGTEPSRTTRPAWAQRIAQ
jgi:putative nucleotidyltransferase with HDIG domain